MYVPEPWSEEDLLALFYDVVPSVQMPPLNVQEHGPVYKEICKYSSVSLRARIKKMPYLRSYRYMPALAYKH